MMIMITMDKRIVEGYLDPGCFCFHLLRIRESLLPLGLHLPLQAG